MRGNEREKGTALIVAMIALFVITGLVTSLFTVVHGASRESAAQIEYTSTLHGVSGGVDRALAAVYNVRQTDAGFTRGFDPATGESNWIAFADGGPYTVYARSLKRNGFNVGTSHDFYEITSIGAPTPLGYMRGVQAIIETPGDSITIDSDEPPPPPSDWKTLIYEVFNGAIGARSLTGLYGNPTSMTRGGDAAGGGGKHALSLVEPATASDLDFGKLEGIDPSTGNVVTGQDAITEQVVPLEEIINVFRAKLDQAVTYKGTGPPASRSGIGTPTDYQFTKHTGDFHLNASAGDNGYGILFIDGDLKITGNGTWAGILVVTGDVEMNGNPGMHTVFEGAIISGGSLDIGGTARYQFNSAQVEKALTETLPGGFEFTYEDFEHLRPPVGTVTVPTTGTPVMRAWRVLDAVEVDAFLATVEAGNWQAPGSLAE